MEAVENTVNAELLALTYGAFISQIARDYEEVEEINKQIEQLGYSSCGITVRYRYNMGIRLVEEYLAKTRTREVQSFKNICENIASKAFPMYVGCTAVIEKWSEDEQSCVLSS